MVVQLSVTTKGERDNAISGTRIGGLKTARKHKKNYGDDYYRTIGRIGGKAHKGGGFTADATRALEASIKGMIARGIKPRPETYAKLEALQAAGRALEASVQDDTLLSIYGPLNAQEVPVRTITVTEHVPSYLYAVWILASAIAIWTAFLLGTVAYK